MKYEKWSLGYWCLKQYVTFADWLIHKKITTNGKEKIPQNKPILFAPNHQNALSDPMAVLLHTRFQPVWLARADIFKSKTVAAILRFLKIMPVYRLRDGKENLAKNDQTFTDSIKVLENNGALALFPEAAHSGKRQMLAHKKAVPRIVFMAEEKAGYNLDIQIVPTGIYYNHYWKFNRCVLVNFGKPIPVQDYLEEYKTNPNAATISLREAISDAILPLILNINSKKYYTDFENIREIYGKHFLKKQGKKYSLLNLFQSNQKLVAQLDKLEAEKPEETEKLVSQVKEYQRNLKKHKLRSWVVEKRKSNLINIIGTRLLLLMGLPVFLYGFLLNAIPYFTIDRLIRKKVKDRTFWSSFFLVAGIVLFPVIYIIEILALGWLLPSLLWKIIFVVSLPFAGKLAFQWYILLRKIIGRTRFVMLKLTNKKEYQNIVQQQENLFNLLDKLIPD
ncbi:1-acyl-sn-glycerol-3-phosphate acyltransferase [Maribellus maritimus]|uniref:1-acyl-sn-glycerol-3-phosphate acyltransferase n=1 Tax=Maribellus maritimus TaxID=2870838 RepID=UPI001EEA0997|nr:1-acyl-sn-glycerol-3-phosphate acyltransferase [Maribellus maritimus]MCG6187941.1 1-acyl-sn-glycerol-3-phosphate acyltransferase [Maribellus maritimus]